MQRTPKDFEYARIYIAEMQGKEVGRGAVVEPDKYRRSPSLVVIL